MHKPNGWSVVALAALSVACATPSLAQSPPPPPGPDRPAPPPPAPRGASIRIDRPDMSIAVRCAEGEGTRACGEIIAQLIEKLAAMPAADRRGDEGRRRGGFRDRDDGGTGPDEGRRRGREPD